MFLIAGILFASGFNLFHTDFSKVVLMVYYLYSSRHPIMPHPDVPNSGDPVRVRIQPLPYRFLFNSVYNIFFLISAVTLSCHILMFLIAGILFASGFNLFPTDFSKLVLMVDYLYFSRHTIMPHPDVPNSGNPVRIRIQPLPYRFLQAANGTLQHTVPTQRLRLER